MKLIVGLGNPGTEYEKTRHNVGFMAVDLLAEKLGAVTWKEEHKAQTAAVRIDGEKCLLVRPQTFMNLSGDAVGKLAAYYKVEPQDIIVVYDDMDLPVGVLRIRTRGSAGGHNGMKSVIAALGTQEFPHVRVGVGRPAAGWTVIAHVLAAPQGEEWQAMQEGVQKAAEAALAIAELGVDLAMNRLNPQRRSTARGE